MITAVAASDCCAALEAARASWMASAVLWWPETRGVECLRYSAQGAECLARIVARGVGAGGVGAAAGVSADGQ